MNVIIDTWCQEDCTMGRLSYGAFHCFTLELPWKDNQQNISCIPAGTYKAKKYNSPTKGLVLLLIDVPGRNFIEVHYGNFTYEIEGCTIVGDGIVFLDSDSIPDVKNSKKTLEKFLNLIPDEVTIDVTRSYSPYAD